MLSGVPRTPTGNHHEQRLAVSLPAHARLLPYLVVGLLSHPQRRHTRDKVSERIVSRALFLMGLPSQAGRASSQELSKRRWSLLARLAGTASIARTPSQGLSVADGELA